MFPALRPFTQTKQSVSKLFSVVRKNGADAQWAGALKVSEEATRVGRCLAVVDADEDPAGGAINCNKQIAPGGLIRHLRQILHVDVDVSGLISLEAAVLGAGVLGLEIAQVADAVPTQAAIQPRAGNVRIKKFPNHGQQIIQ